MSKLELFPYQLEALDIMRDMKHNLVFDEMGLGKTATTLKHIERYLGKGEKVVIICPVIALYVWMFEIKKWTNLRGRLYLGTPKERQIIMGKFIRNDDDYLITTTGVYQELVGPLPWKFIVMDEIHRIGMLNHKTQMYKYIDKYGRDSDQVILLTGSPIRRGCIDMFAPLKISDSRRFSSYWGYVNRWCTTTQTPFGKQIDYKPANVDMFRAMTREYMVRRLTDEVKTSLPANDRHSVPIAMTKKQRQLYNELEEELVAYDHNSDILIVSANRMNAQLRMRQLLISPRLLGIDDDGGAIEYLKEVLPDYLSANKPVVLFTPYIAAVELLCKMVQALKMGTQTYYLHGSMSPNKFADNWTGFQNNPTKNKVLVCCIKSGASFHATEAANSFFVGCEFDFNLNEQAEKRLHRTGQSLPVKNNYLLYQDCSLESRLLEILNNKKRGAIISVGSDDEYQKLLRKYQPSVGSECL